MKSDTQHTQHIVSTQLITSHLAPAIPPDNLCSHVIDSSWIKIRLCLNSEVQPYLREILKGTTEIRPQKSDFRHRRLKTFLLRLLSQRWCRATTAVR